MCSKIELSKKLSFEKYDFWPSCSVSFAVNFIFEADYEIHFFELLGTVHENYSKRKSNLIG